MSELHVAREGWGACIEFPFVWTLPTQGTREVRINSGGRQRRYVRKRLCLALNIVQLTLRKRDMLADAKDCGTGRFLPLAGPK